MNEPDSVSLEDTSFPSVPGSCFGTTHLPPFPPFQPQLPVREIHLVILSGTAEAAVTTGHMFIAHVSFRKISGSLQSGFYGIILFTGKIEPALEGYKAYIYITENSRTTH